MKTKCTQNYDSITISFPTEATSSNIKVTSMNKHITVIINSETVIDKALADKIEADDTFWYIEDGDLHIQMTKANNAWWGGAFEGEEDDDMKQENAETPVNQDLMDDETKIMMEKMMWEMKNKK